MASRLQALTADLAARTAPKFEPPEAPKVAIRPEDHKFPPVAVGVNAPRAKTAPGQMLAVRTQMLASDGELEKLREELKQYDGSIPAIKLDPKVVHRSKWANRDPKSFTTPKFASLKSEIEEAGGNIQPILVRPIKGRAGEYEVVFGHRRLQACLELNLDVLALIAEIDMPDAKLFAAMDRENRERQDLSPFEQGRMYALALEEKLFPSARQLADFLGVSNAWVSKSMSVANLPAPVLEAFNSPLEIQPGQAKDIQRVLDSDQKGVLRRIEKIRGQNLSASAVTQYLVHGPKASAAGGKVALETGGRKLGFYKISSDGAATVSLGAKTVNDEEIEEVVGAFRQALIRMRTGAK